MALTSDEQQKVTNGLMRAWSRIWDTVAISKADLLAAVVATDGWIEDNQASFNASLPDAARNSLALEQKTLMFCAVSCARVSMAFLRRVFGEVD